MKEATDLWIWLAGAVIAALAVLVKTVRQLRRLGRMVDEFLGYDDHPGAVERIANLEDRISELERLMSIHITTVHGVDTDAQ